MRSKRFTVLTVSVLVLLFPLYRLVQACGGDIDPYDYYPQFFPPSVTQQPALIPFHYTSQLKYYDDWYDYEATDTIADANIAAWAAYTGNTVGSPDLDSFIYAYPYSELSSLYHHLEKGKPLQLRPGTERNAFTKWFMAGKDLEALGYLMYAKQCEPHVARSGDWEAPKADTARMGRLMRNGLQLHAAAEKEAIRERYAFQILRLALYSGNYRKTLELYSKLIGDDRSSGSELFARCLGLKAGALFRLKRKTEAAYLYSRVFDLSANAKRSSYVSFDWATTADARPVLALCKSPHEQAVVHLMDGLNNFEQALPQIRAAWAADPQVKGLDVLFTREINKVEERYLQDELMRKRNLKPDLWYFDHYNGGHSLADSGGHTKSTSWEDYAGTLRSFALQAADAPAGRKSFWLLSAAYLSYVLKDVPNTSRYLTMAQSAGLSPRERELSDGINALRILSGGLSPREEGQLLPYMQALDARAATNRAAGKIYRDLMSTVITTAYLQRGDTARAVYALGRSNRGESGFWVAEDFTDLPGSLLERISPDKLRELQRFIAGTSKSPWDTWLTVRSPYSADMLKELEGTKYLRQHEFRKAADVLAGVSPALLEKYILPDPFLARIRDEMERDSLDTAHMYSKLAFARKMDSLQQRNDPEGLFEYGCGLYSMTYYGKAAHAYEYYRSSVDGLAYYASPERAALPPYAQEYYSAQAAEQRFIRAAQLTGDSAFRARCLWMAAKCWQKRRPAAKAEQTWARDDDKAYYLNSLKNPYFVQLEAFRATPFMQSAYSSCGYLRDYARKK